MTEEVYVFPMSFAQQRLWFLNQFEQHGTPFYNIPANLHISGSLNVGVLEQSINEIIHRHEILRTTFTMMDNEPVQVITPMLTITVPVIDLQRVHENEKTDKVRKLAAEEVKSPFNLAEGPLLRVTLLRLGEDEHVLLVTMHHIISDGWSRPIFSRELSALYEAFSSGKPSPLPELPIQYVDYTSWQRELLQQGETLETQLNYWKQQLADAPQTLNLPTDNPRPEQLSYRGADVTFLLDEDLTQTLKAFSRQQDCTLFMTLMAVYAVLLSRYSGQKDLLIATPIAGRHHHQIENLIGFFVNNLIIRVKLGNTLNFTGLLAGLRQTLLEAYAHQDLPFEKLIEALNIPRHQNYTPLSQAAFTLNVMDTPELQLLGLEIEPLPVSFDVAKTDLTLALTENAGQLQGNINYSTDLFTGATITQFADDFQTLLKLLLEQSQQPLRRVLKNSGIQSRNSTIALDMTGLAEHSNLTPNQLLIWLGQQVKPEEEAVLYQNQYLFHLPFAVSHNHFQSALDTLIRSCDALRTVFCETGGVPRQQVLPELVYQVDWVDFSAWSAPDEALQSWAMKRNTQILSLSERLFDVALIKLAREHFVLYLNIHQLIGDGMAIDLIFSNLSRFYRQAEAGQLPVKVELPQFQNYLDDTETYLDSSRYQQDETYWQQFRSAPLSFYGKTPRRHSGRVHCVRYDMTVAEMRCLHLRVSQLADVRQVNHAHLMYLFNTMLVVYLHKISQSTEIVIGISRHNRRTRPFKQTIGSFMQVLPIQVSMGTDDSFVSLYHKVKQAYQTFLQHGQYVLRNPSQNPVYEVVLNYHIASYDEFAGHPVKTDKQRATYSSDLLTLNIHDFAQSGQLRLEFDLNIEVFDKAERHYVIEHFRRVLSALLDNPEQPLTTVSLLTPAAQRQLIQWNQTETHYAKDQTIIDLFEQQVEKAPDNIAVVFEVQSLTYAQLNAKANQLAHYLVSQDSPENFLMGICAERSLEMIIGLLGILKAGGAYVPLDQDYPLELLEFMLQDSTASILLTQSHLKEKLPEHQAKIICLDDWTPFENWSDRNPEIEILSDSLAYVIYTSGSTGKPKGVQIPHANLSNAYHGWASAYHLDKLRIHLQMASFSFDVFTGDWVRALCSGAILVLCPRDHLLEPAKLYALIQQEQIDCGEFVPSVLRSLWQYLRETGQKLDISLLIAGSELWYLHEYATLKACCKTRTRLVSSYGVSEATIDSSYFEQTHPTTENMERSVPIGKPFYGTKLWILDNHQQPVPPGIPGELCIAGAGLARGYLNRTELTAKKFIEVELFGKTERIYKTGDLARWLPDGNLEYLGRLDHQIKLRGFRIELGEIELTLSQHEAIKEAVVVLYHQEDNPRLVAYVTSAMPIFDVAGVLRTWLKTRLPEYMLPANFTVLDKLPLTPNGKIDRKALSQLSVNIDLSEGEFVAPRTQEEKLLADIWADVLGVERVGIHNNFFDLGGYSLLIIRVQAKLSECFDQKISMVELFEHPTIHTLAQHLMKQTKQTTQNRADNRRIRQTSTRQQRQARQKHRSKN